VIRAGVKQDFNQKYSAQPIRRAQEGRMIYRGCSQYAREKKVEAPRTAPVLI